MISTKIGETDIHIGDTLKVHVQIVESGKTRVQIFEGILIRLRGRSESRPGLLSSQTFTVRKIGAGAIGVERTWPVDAKNIVKIEIKKKNSGVRRSKLFYLRDLTGKSAVRV